MKKIIVILVVMVMVVNCFSQAGNWVWARQGTGNSGTNVEGRSVTYDLFGNSYETGSFMDTVSFGSIILIPQSTGSNANNYLVKYNSSGTVVWAKSFGGFGCTAKTDAIGNIYVAGAFADGVGIVTIGSYTITSLGSFDVFIAKFDASGSVLWVKTAGGIGNDGMECNGITIDSYGNIIISGYFESSTISFGTTNLTNSSGNGGLDNLFVAKYDSSGNLLWAKRGSGNFAAFSVGIVTDDIGNIFITSAFYSSSIDFGGASISLIGDTDMFLVELNPLGQEILIKNFGLGNTHNYGYSIAINSYKDLYITGLSYPPGSSNNEFCTTIKCDSLGVLKWRRNATTNYASAGYNLALDACENIFVVGGMQGNPITFDTLNLLPVAGAGSDNMFLVKYDSSGTVLWGEVLGGGGDDIISIAIDNDGNVYIVGDFIPNQFVIGNDTLIKNGGEYPFIAKLYAPCFIGQSIPEINHPQSSIQISPNPTTSLFTITFTEPQKNTTIKILDVLGNVLHQSTITTQQSTIDVSGYAKGIYFVRIESFDTSTGSAQAKNVMNRKIVLQ